MRYTYEQPEYIDRVGVAHLVNQLKIYIDGIANGNIDLSDYVTKSELQAKLDALHINIDLSAYATKEELTNALSNIDLSAYALKTEIPSLEGYATQEYVTNAINNAQLGGDGSSVDLSIYAKKSDLDSKANTNHTHAMSDITDYTAPDLSSYAKKTDIPSLSGYATKTYVDQNKFSGSYNDLTNKPTIPSIDGLATTQYVDNAVSNIPTTDLSNYYTKNETYSKTEVDTAISNIEGGAPTKDLLYESVIRQGGALKSLKNEEVLTLEDYYGADYLTGNTITYVNEYITKGLYIYNEPEKILTHGYDLYGSEVGEGGYTEEEKVQNSINLANKLISEGKYKGVFAIKYTSDVVKYDYNDAWLTNDDLIIGKPIYVYGYVLDTFCGLSQGAYILKVIPSGTVMKKTDIVEIIPVGKERVEVPCNLSLVNHLSMFSTGQSPHYKKQWKEHDTSRRCTDREINKVITFPKGNDDSEFVLSRFGYPQYTITNGTPEGIVLQGVDYSTSSACYLIGKGLERETYVIGNTNTSITHYSLDEWAKKIDDSISNVDVKADLSGYQYEPQKYKYEYLNIYGTKLNIEMPQLPTFDGGTVLHITPPDGWRNFINAGNDCMTVYVKKDKNREYVDVMNDDIICNVDSQGHATPTLTIPNTTATGFLDNYIIRGTQYVPNGGVVSYQSKEQGWLYDYQNNELGGGYTKWSTDHFEINGNGGGIDAFKLTFDTSKRTGSVTFNLLSNEHDWYIKGTDGGVIRKSPSVTVDVTNVDTYDVYVPVGSNDDLSVICPGYTISYPDEIVSGTFKIWTSDIDVVNVSTQYEFTVNINQFTDEYYVRYGNEKLVKSRKPIIPTRASELLNDVPFATETYVNEKVAEVPNNVDLSNYYTKSETDALIPTVIDGVVNGKDGVTPHIDETTKHWFIGDTDTGILAEGTNGTNGDNGVSPTVSVTETTNGHTVAITDVNSTQSFDVTNGTNGTNGVSPTVTVTKEGKIATITCTDVNGTTTTTISDGADGQGGGTADLSNYYTKEETYSKNETYNKTEVDTLVANSGGGGSSSGGASGITYAYDTEIAIGDTWIDGKPIYMKVFHIDALSTKPKDISMQSYYEQPIFADQIVSVNTIWKQTNSNGDTYIDGNSVISPSNVNTSSSYVGSNVNDFIIGRENWVKVNNFNQKSTPTFSITVARGASNYDYSCDVIMKYTKSA